VRIFHKQCKSLGNAGYQVHLVVGDDRGDEITNGVSIHGVGKREGRLKRMLVTTWQVLKKGHKD